MCRFFKIYTQGCSRSCCNNIFQFSWDNCFLKTISHLTVILLPKSFSDSNNTWYSLDNKHWNYNRHDTKVSNLALDNHSILFSTKLWIISYPQLESRQKVTNCGIANILICSSQPPSGRGLHHPKISSFQNFNSLLKPGFDFILCVSRKEQFVQD